MTLETQVKLAESDNGSIYNQKEWLEEYNEYNDDLWTSASIFSNKFANVLVKYF